MIYIGVCNVCMCLFTVVLKRDNVSLLHGKISRYLSWACDLFLSFVFFYCPDMCTGSVFSSLWNPGLRTLTALLLSLYPAVSPAFIWIVIMLVFLVTGQHFIVEGLLEAQMQTTVTLRKNFKGKSSCSTASFLIQSKFLWLGCLKLNQVENEMNCCLSNTNNLNCRDT